MKRVAVLVVTLVGGLSGAAARADDVTLETVPSVVVKTVPEAGAGEVNPKLTEIKVTFSKDMQDATRSPCDWRGRSGSLVGSSTGTCIVSQVGRSTAAGPRLAQTS